MKGAGVRDPVPALRPRVLVMVLLSAVRTLAVLVSLLVMMQVTDRVAPSGILTPPAVALAGIALQHGLPSLGLAAGSSQQAELVALEMPATAAGKAATVASF